MGEIEDQKQSSRVEWLIDEADDQGYLLLDQIMDAFPEAERDLSQLEELFAELHDEDIQIYESEEDIESEANTEDVEPDEEEDEEAVSVLRNISPDDTVSLYFKEMGQEPLLTREQEIELAKRMERGQEAERELARNSHSQEKRAKLERIISDGEAAREHLIKANTRLVVSIAKRYRGQGMSFLDLIQAGNIGLIKAADKFDYRRGNKFGTYATWWIRQSIARTLKQQGRTIRIPVHTTDRIRKLYKTAQRMEQDLGHRPTPEEIADEMDLDPEEVRWLLEVSRRPYSLERPVGEEEDSEFGDFIEDESAPSPVQTAELHMLHDELQEALTALTPREVRVLRMRFGLGGEETYTLREVGEKLGVTRERIRQIEGQALKKLRHARHRRKLQAYLS